MARTIARPEDEVRRTERSGTAWFAAGIIAAGIVLAGLLAGGWRPADLPDSNAAAWWTGSVLLVLGLAGLAYAGCPVEGPDILFDDRTKTVAIRAGVALYGVGAVVAMLGVLLAPAAGAG